MIAAGLAPPLGDVVGAGFSTLAGARAYTLAGSFSAFLLATRGADKLRALYRSAGNFTDVYRVPLRDLEREWRQFLTKQPLSTRQRAHATEEFRRPAIFSRVCARELAARVAEARGLDGRRSGARRRAPAVDLPRRSERAAATAWRWRAPSWRPAPRGRPATELGHLALDGDADRPAARGGGVARRPRSISTRATSPTPRRTSGARSSWRRPRRTGGRRLAKLRALGSPPARATLGRALFADDARAGRSIRC